MNHIMIDLETLSLRHNAAIASIGAVKFNKSDIIDTFSVNVDLTDCQNRGLDIDASTVYWWLGQTKEAQESLLDITETLHDALNMLSDWLEDTEHLQIWANGMKDFQWLESALIALGEKTDSLWKFYQERDFRTIKAMSPIVQISDEDVAHSALSDARWQARYMIELANKGYIRLD